MGSTRRDGQSTTRALTNFAAALFLVMLGAVNLVHNIASFFRGAPGNWWPAILGVFLFGAAPLLVGCWLFLRKANSHPE